MPECKEHIISEAYADFIGEVSEGIEALREKYNANCPEFVNSRYVIFYAPFEKLEPLNIANYPYSTIPKLYGLMDTTAPAATGAIRLQNQTGFELTGRDVIIGFIDTGIDYTNPIFCYRSGQTRIIGIWDQTDQSGNTPDGFYYGSEYTMEDINRALESENPLEVVPHTDTIGHGTFLAGVACARYDEQNDFIGTAPDSLLAIVKLKPAKQYLRDFFMIGTDAPAYQENDIMLAVSYLQTLKEKYKKPLVIVLGIGSGSGDRAGGSPLSQQLNDTGEIVGNCIVVCSGNEGNERLHYGAAIEENQIDDVEIRVDENNAGFVLELWGNSPDVFSVAFVSPLGESVPRIPARKGVNERINFLLEGTVIEIGYSLVESGKGNELIFMRFINPSPGIWTIRVYGTNILTGKYDIWANLRQFTNEGTYFLKPSPEMTITVPSSSESVISVGGYNHTNNSIYPRTGRGFTSDYRVKPDIVAPAVNVFGPGTNRNYLRATGTSIATALTAGCCAQMMQWGIVQQNEPYMKTNYIKKYFLRGAVRERDIEYPSSQWGFGQLNVYNSFVILTRT